MSSRTRDVLVAALLFGAIVAVAVTPGSFFNPSRGDTQQWYDALNKPSFNPPNTVFAPVWTILYILIAIAGARVWLAAPSPERSLALRLWALQLVLNAVWSPLFFGARRPELALVDIVLMLGAIAAFVWRAWRVDRVAAWLMLPYLGWVAFATALNLAIVLLNR
jgi:translocator protein